MAVEVFEISQSNNAWLSWLLLLPIVLALLLAVLFWPRPLRLEVDADSLTVRGTVYGRSIPRRELALEGMRLVDLEREPGLAPALRTNGVALPSYRVGWFKLQNGQRALCLLTNHKDVLYVPTRAGYALLVSVADGQKLMAALRAAP